MQNTQRDIKMIGLDLDGTVFDSSKQISRRVIDAIARAIRSGIIVLPATGRQLAGVPPAFLEIPGVRYALTSNGARVYDMADNNRVLHVDAFDRDTALSILALCYEYDAFISVFLNGEGYADEKKYDQMDSFLTPELCAYIRAYRNPIGNLEAHISEPGMTIEKFTLLIMDPAQRLALKAALEARGDCVVTSSLPNNLEINTPTANKGAGLLALGAQLGIKREEIMAMGDESNDCVMLQMVGYGVAMGNAGPEVKAVADAVSPSCDEDGVAVAIEALLDGSPL